MCKPYNEFEKTLEDYNKIIVNETDPIKKQELITFKRAFLWENPIMYRVYKAIRNTIGEDAKVAANLFEEDFNEDSMFTYCHDCPHYEPYNARFGLCKKLSVFSYHEDFCATDCIKSKEDKGLIEKIDKLLNE